MKNDQLESLRREAAEKVAELCGNGAKGLAAMPRDREQLMLATMLHSTIAREQEMRMKTGEFAEMMEKSLELHRSCVLIMNSEEIAWEQKADRLFRLVVRFCDALLEQ